MTVRPSFSSFHSSRDLPDALSRAASSFTLVDTASPPRPSSPLPSASPSTPTLHLLSRAAGRPRLARLAAQLAASGTDGMGGEGGKGELTAEEVAGAIDGAWPVLSRFCSAHRERTRWSVADTPRMSPAALPLGEPDLLLVLGGSYLRLLGFPPWQLRLTELQYVPLPLPLRPSPLLPRPRDHRLAHEPRPDAPSLSPSCSPSSPSLLSHLPPSTLLITLHPSAIPSPPATTRTRPGSPPSKSSTRTCAPRSTRTAAPRCASGGERTRAVGLGERAERSGARRGGRGACAIELRGVLVLRGRASRARSRFPRDPSLESGRARRRRRCERGQRARNTELSREEAEQ